ncbi:hypothetical protein [Kitasatospora sp. NPDC087314]
MSARYMAGAAQVSGEVDQAGRLSDLGAGTKGAVLFQRGVSDLAR